MPEQFRNWGGAEWQDYCILLLHARYTDHTLVVIPDRHEGDLGLEAFTHSGNAYQCYAAQEPLETAKRYEKQRDKLTRDLAKLRIRASDVKTLLGDVIIERYVLMVPQHDSRQLVAHAQAKAAEVRGWGLDFISQDFTITIETDDAYPHEREDVLSIPTSVVCLAAPPAHERAAWAAEHGDLFEDARRKLGTLGLASTEADKYLDQLLNKFLIGQNALDQLRSWIPEGWEAVSLTQSTMEDSLMLEYPPGATNSARDLKMIVDEMSGLIHTAAPPLGAEASRMIAWGVVADWILRCPLDFKAAVE